MKAMRWLTAYPWVAPVVFGAVLVAVVAFGMWRDRKHDEALGKAEATVARLRSELIRLAAQASKVDTQYRTDTAALRFAEDRYRAVAAEARRLASLANRPGAPAVHDTIRTDSSALAVALTGLALADTTIRACRQTVQTCEQRVAIRDSLLRVVGAQRDADRALYRAKLAAATPRIRTELDAMSNPFDPTTFAASATVSLRLLGPLSVTAGAQYWTFDTHQSLAPVVGVRVVLR